MKFPSGEKLSIPADFRIVDCRKLERTTQGHRHDSLLVGGKLLESFKSVGVLRKSGQGGIWAHPSSFFLNFVHSWNAKTKLSGPSLFLAESDFQRMFAVV